MSLASSALRRPVATSTIVIGLIVIGLYTLRLMGIDFLPKMDLPYVTIVTVYPGAGPKEVETLVSKKIEDAVSEVDGIKYVRSLSMENASQVFIEFNLGTNLDFAAMDVREKLDKVLGELPDDAEKPVILKVDVNAKPVMNLVLSSDTVPVGELYDMADRSLRDRLSQVPGVATVDLIGGKKRQIQVLADLTRLSSHGLSILNVIQAVGAENLDLPSGHLTESGREYSVRFEGEFDRPEDVALVEIPLPTGRTVKLTDVARVADDYEEQRIASWYNGDEGVVLRIKKKADANTVAVVDTLLARVPELGKMLPSGVSLDVANEDSAFIRNSVSDLLNNMLVGTLLTVLILYLFLHNLRATVVAAAVIPICIISTLIPMYFAGFTLNIMTLMALALSVGVLVMNALVVLENIYRHLDRGESPTSAAVIGTSEISLAVVGSAGTNLVVFLPIAFMSGIIGQLFYQFGVAVVFATVVSLLASFTVTPILASLLCKRQDAEGRRGVMGRFLALWDRGYSTVERLYGRALAASLHRRALTLAVSLALFFGAALLAGRIGSELITEPDRSEATITLEMPAGTTMAQTEHVLRKVNDGISSMPEIKGILTTVGKIEGMLGKSTEGVHVGQVMVFLKDKSDREKNIRQVMEEIRKRLSGIPAASVAVMQPSGIGGVEAPIQLEIMGPDFEELQKIGVKAIEAARDLPGAVDVETTWRAGKPELKIVPDRKRLADAGIPAGRFAMVMRAYLEGLDAGKFRDRGEEYDIRVKLSGDDREFAEKVDDMMIALPFGGSVPVSQLARVSEETGPVQILRKDKSRMIIVSMNVRGRSVGEVAGDLDRKLAAETLPSGYRLHQSGQVERMKESFADILMALILAVILTYLVLAALLESYLTPFSIMLTVPLGLIGVWVALYLTGESFNIFSMMAVVMLVGIVVNNAILIIDYMKVLERDGEPRDTAMLRAAAVRLRPIIMTTLAAAAAMVPMALALGWGAEMWASMAVASIGGLLSSAALSLFVVPAAYTLLDDLALRVKAFAKKGR
ncbi:MAG: efflux RND transporter permease subunit [Thermodesulfobacteriota bacterium]